MFSFSPIMLLFCCAYLLHPHHHWPPTCTWPLDVRPNSMLVRLMAPSMMLASGTDGRSGLQMYVMLTSCLSYTTILNFNLDTTLPVLFFNYLDFLFNGTIIPSLSVAHPLQEQLMLESFNPNTTPYWTLNTCEIFHLFNSTTGQLEMLPKYICITLVPFDLVQDPLYSHCERALRNGR